MPRRTGCSDKTKRAHVGRVLVSSLFGAAVTALALSTRRSQGQERSSTVASWDAASTSTTTFGSARPRPHHVATTIGHHAGEKKKSAAEERAPIVTAERLGPVAPPPRTQLTSPLQARRRTVEGAQEDRGPEDKVSVYVYDGVPELDFSGLIQCYRDRHDGVPPWQDERADMAQDMGEIWLHRSILSHPWRVHDPDMADLFFIPMYPVLSYKVELGGVSPLEPKSWERNKANRCEGLTHTARMDAAVDYLSRFSPFFNRFGGADHVVVCAWWNCRVVFDSRHRMLFRRTVIGINENIFGWHRWGCGPGRAVTVPYTASSVLTTRDMIGGRPAEERDIPFFFVGTARNRPERRNLDVVQNISEDSVVLLGGNGRDWGMNATEYAEHISRSRFCFCPRGDSMSSRRIFDALAAGCIPIVTEDGKNVLPYVGNGLDYSEFAIVVGAEAFSTREGVTNTTLDVLARSDIEVAELRSGAALGVDSLLYGITIGATVGDMLPFRGTSTNFLQASYELAAGGAAEGYMHLWDCPATDLPEGWLAPRTQVELPPPPPESRQWLSESETIVNKERSLLFCAPPNAGSLQFRMLAKRMQGVSHWAVADDWSLLFDPADSELELLDVTDGALMTKAYRDNDSGWIKIAVVRDPVTRLLSAYLDVVRAWRAGLQAAESQSSSEAPLLKVADVSAEPQPPGHDRKRRLRLTEGARAEVREEKIGGRATPLGGSSSEWALLDTVLQNRRRRRQQQGDTARSGKEDAMATRETRHGGKDEEESGTFTWEGLRGLDGVRDPSAARSLSGEEAAQDSAGVTGGPGDDFFGDSDVNLPTLAEVVDALKVKLWEAPVAFRPSSSLCGMQNSPFDSIIPFERLQQTSTDVLKSLPGDVWDSFGASGWGPDGDLAFMEFDYGGAAWRKNVGAQAEGEGLERRDGEYSLPRRAGDLFEEESCAWADYYGDMETLESAGELYAVDYSHFGWYQFAPWRERLKECLDRKNR